MHQVPVAPGTGRNRPRIRLPEVASRAGLPAKRPTNMAPVTFGAALAAMVALAAIMAGGVAGYNVSTDRVDELRSSEESSPAADGPSMPQALSLTTLLAEEPTAGAFQASQTDGSSLQPLSEQNLPPSPQDVAAGDGRRRRRLGRKRKRRPLQDDYWPPSDPVDNDTESNGFAPSAAGRVSDRKRLPYAGAAASRWEGIPPKGTGTIRQGFRPGGANPQRAGDWMHNPYTDAVVNAEQHPVAALRRPSGASLPVGANLSPIDPNRSRRIGGVRSTEPPPTNAKAYRKPYSQARRSEEQFEETEATRLPTSATDLKALLKQSDGLSLSEILQQRNISLQDLIKGKQMALAALTQSPLDVTTTTTPGDDQGTTLSDVSGGTTLTTSSPTTTTTTTTTTSLKNDLLTTSGVNDIPSPSAPEDELNNAVVDDLGHGVGVIFPTVEIKQLTLNPVLPVLKDEQRLHRIKGVASRIRPDLSNTHIRTEVMGMSTTTGSPTMSPTNPSLLLMTSTARERWTPSAALVGQRQKLQITGKHQFHQGRTTSAVESDVSATMTTSSMAVSTTEEPPTARELHATRLSSAETTSILPEAEAMVELSPGRLHQHLLRVPKVKSRIAIKPKLTNVVPPTMATEGPMKVTAKDALNLSDVELGDEGAGGDGPVANSGGKQGRRLNDEDDDEGSEPELNIIEKFTSFAEPPGSSGQEQDRDRESEQAAVADLIGRISEHTQRSFTDSLEDLYRDVTESNPSLFNDLSPIASADDRRELLELMEDRRIGSRLAKVLSQRNMTLEQLLEHRRRGSSQLHLAEIANGKVKPIDDKIDIVTAFEHFPRFNIGNLRSIRPDDIKLDSQGFSYFTSIINIRPADEAYKEPRALQGRHQQQRGVHRTSNEAHFLVKGGSKDRLLVPSKMSAGTGPAYGSNGASDYDHNDGDLLDLELSGHGFQHHRSASVTIESTSMPVGVRSAIVASSAIVGVSLTIFIAIFVACRLRQRRRQKLNYTENFNMAKGRLPILHGDEQEARKSSPPSVSGRSSGLDEQVVFTTHRALAGCGSSGSGAAGTMSGRQRAALMDPNSVEVQDYLWDRKPFQ